MKLNRYIAAAAIAGSLTVFASTPVQAQQGRSAAEIIFDIIVESQRHPGHRREQRIDELYRNGVNQVTWGQLDSAERTAEEIQEIERTRGFRTDLDERLAESIARSHYENGTRKVGWGDSYLNQAETDAEKIRRLERNFDINTDLDTRLFQSIARAYYEKGMRQVGWGADYLNQAETSLDNVIEFERKARFAGERERRQRENWERERHERSETLSYRLIESIINAHYEIGIRHVGWGGNYLDGARRELSKINELEDRYHFNSDRDEQLREAIWRSRRR